MGASIRKLSDLFGLLLFVSWGTLSHAADGACTKADLERWRQNLQELQADAKNNCQGGSGGRQVAGGSPRGNKCYRGIKEAEDKTKEAMASGGQEVAKKADKGDFSGKSAVDSSLQTTTNAASLNGKLKDCCQETKTRIEAIKKKIPQCEKKMNEMFGQVDKDLEKLSSSEKKFQGRLPADAAVAKAFAPSSNPNCSQGGYCSPDPSKTVVKNFPSRNETVAYKSPPSGSTLPSGTRSPAAPSPGLVPDSSGRGGSSSPSPSDGGGSTSPTGGGGGNTSPSPGGGGGGSDSGSGSSGGGQGMDLGGLTGLLGQQQDYLERLNELNLEQNPNLDLKQIERGDFASQDPRRVASLDPNALEGILANEGSIEAVQSSNGNDSSANGAGSNFGSSKFSPDMGGKQAGKAVAAYNDDFGDSEVLKSLEFGSSRGGGGGFRRRDQDRNGFKVPKFPGFKLPNAPGDRLPANAQMQNAVYDPTFTSDRNANLFHKLSNAYQNLSASWQADPL